MKTAPSLVAHQSGRPYPIPRRKPNSGISREDAKAIIDFLTARRPYLDCLKGVKVGKVPGPGEAGCPKISGKATEQQALKGALVLTLETLRVLFGNGA